MSRINCRKDICTSDFKKFRWKNLSTQLAPHTSGPFLACGGGGAERAQSPTGSDNFSQIQNYTALRYNFFTLTNTIPSVILHLSPSLRAKPMRTTKVKFPHSNAIEGRPIPRTIFLLTKYEDSLFFC